MIAVLVIAPRLNDLAALLGLEHFELVLVALLPRQVMNDKGEAVRQNPVDADPPHPAAKAELIRRDHHLHVALERLAPCFFEQRVEEPDRSREQQSSRGHIVVKDVQPGQHHQCGGGCLAEIVGDFRPRGRQHSRDHAESRVSVVVGFLPRLGFSVEGASDCSSNGLHARISFAGCYPAVIEGVSTWGDAARRPLVDTSHLLAGLSSWRAKILAHSTVGG